ncbi:unnamed protein product [Peniophora sp. CBMAI 1063]|nr:unnamed protein product [Peniophora sp. CBMAI 1063]
MMLRTSTRKGLVRLAGSQRRALSVVQDAVDVEPAASAEDANTREAWLFVDSVFPTRLGSWDLRYLWGDCQRDRVLERLNALLTSTQPHGFQPLSLEPHHKDGGVFVRFKYNASELEDVLPAIERTLKKHAQSHGGVPSTTFLNRGSIWLVRGKPWREDMNRFPTQILRVAFDGPDLSEESLYASFRPFGRIRDLSPPSAVPNTPYRASRITFKTFRSSIIARNVLYGNTVDGTRLRAFYEPPVNAHALRDWITNHPRLSIPVLLFLFGTITLAVFDPVRTFLVEAKMRDWLDYRSLSAYQWIRKNVPIGHSGDADEEEDVEAAWQQRAEAKDALAAYVSDVPSTILFVHGPQGSGKGRMVDRLVKEQHRPTLNIDCAEITKARSDAQLISALARALGYWPVFPYLNNMNNLIDMATKGLIGQPAGLSTSIPEQVSQILDIASAAIQDLKAREAAASSDTIKKMRKASKKRDQAERSWWDVVRGIWHDPRQDVIAAPGVGDLGIGDERLDNEKDALEPPPGALALKETHMIPGVDDVDRNGATRKDRPEAEQSAVRALPLIVLRNFSSSTGSTGRDAVMDVVARWAATLAEGGLAHVVVLADNREDSRSLAKALPARPLVNVALTDADAESARGLMRARLRAVGIKEDLDDSSLKAIDKLGGRASDLAGVLRKVRAGATVEAAVEEIVARGAGELRKAAFGDDAEDARALPWTRAQAWAVLRGLVLGQSGELPYAATLAAHPFGGDGGEGALRAMERAEIVSISTVDGRPAAIRPGRPVLRYVFERLVADEVWRAAMEIEYNGPLVDKAESTVRKSEDELELLGKIGLDKQGWFGGESAAQIRAKYVIAKMKDAQRDLERLEKENAAWKKVLAKDDAPVLSSCSHLPITMSSELECVQHLRERFKAMHCAEIVANWSSTARERSQVSQRLHQDATTLREILRETNAQLNTLAPIGRLPQEILGTVFNLVAEAELPQCAAANTAGSLGWVRLLQICRGWRELCIGMPSLWGRSLGRLPRALPIFVKRAGDHVPLDYYLSTGWDRRLHGDQYPPFTDLDVLHSVSQRVERLELRNGSFTDSLSIQNALAIGSFDALQHLRIESYAVPNIRSPLKADALLTIHFRHFFMPFVAPRLTTLSLHAMHVAFDIPTLYNTLQSCPLLV